MLEAELSSLLSELQTHHAALATASEVSRGQRWTCHRNAATASTTRTLAPTHNPQCTRTMSEATALVAVTGRGEASSTAAASGDDPTTENEGEGDYGGAAASVSRGSSGGDIRDNACRLWASSEAAHLVTVEYLKEVEEQLIKPLEQDVDVCKQVRGSSVTTRLTVRRLVVRHLVVPLARGLRLSRPLGFRSLLSPVVTSTDPGAVGEPLEGRG